MLKRFVVIFVLLNLFFAHASVAESQFRFDRWPLDVFKKESIIKDYGSGHFGLDLAADVGTPVYAPASGKIYWTYSGGNHGISVGLEHESGLKMTFLHLSEKLVKKGEEVKSGQLIGRVGMTGSGRDSESAHLHFAVVANSDASITQPELRYASPLDFLPADLVSQEPNAEPANEQIQKPVEEPISTVYPSEQTLQPLEESTGLNPLPEQMPKPLQESAVKEIKPDQTPATPITEQLPKLLDNPVEAVAASLNKAQADLTRTQKVQRLKEPISHSRKTEKHFLESETNIQAKTLKLRRGKGSIQELKSYKATPSSRFKLNQKHRAANTMKSLNTITQVGNRRKIVVLISLMAIGFMAIGFAYYLWNKNKFLNSKLKAPQPFFAS